MLILAAIIGWAALAAMLAMIAWSLVRPDKRLWPPLQPSTPSKIVVWLLTLAIFASALFLGVADWNALSLPAAVRWSVGLPLIMAGNAVVWAGVAKIGMAATSGDADRLMTDGLYRYSRNPQYTADMAILLGWGVLSASLWALPVILGGIAALLAAPFAEEPWLENTYGDRYAAYRKATRRYL